MQHGYWGEYMSKVIALTTGLVAYFMLLVVIPIVAFEVALAFVREAVEEL